VENQLQPLQEAAGRLGWTVVAVRDEGISGAKGRQQRPGLDALLKGVARREFDIVAAWSVCRLGRSLPDLIGLLGELRWLQRVPDYSNASIAQRLSISLLGIRTPA
jgi:DNA invertase Pin-like site-specific DNA recombinase